jgi:hypothetical protein
MCATHRFMLCCFVCRHAVRTAMWLVLPMPIVEHSSSTLISKHNSHVTARATALAADAHAQVNRAEGTGGKQGVQPLHISISRQALQSATLPQRVNHPSPPFPSITSGCRCASKLCRDGGARTGGAAAAQH